MSRGGHRDGRCDRGRESLDPTENEGGCANHDGPVVEPDRGVSVLDVDRGPGAGDRVLSSGIEIASLPGIPGIDRIDEAVGSVRVGEGMPGVRFHLADHHLDQLGAEFAGVRRPD